MITGDPGSLSGLTGTLVLAGAGKMGGALLDGWLDMGLDPRCVILLDPHAAVSALQRFAVAGVDLNPSRKPTAASTLVLAVKPQALAAAAPVLSPWVGAESLLVSIVAGKTIADLAAAFPQAGAIARAMPNTPAAVRRGITGIYASATTGAECRRELSALLGAVGSVEWLTDESMIDSVTAVSGSGPAYVFYLTECLAKAAEELGLEPEAAARLARATVEGAAALMSASADVPPDVLRANVTSPGGTTAAALDVLTADGRLERAMAEAVKAARERAQQLAG